MPVVAILLVVSVAGPFMVRMASLVLAPMAPASIAAPLISSAWAPSAPLARMMVLPVSVVSSPSTTRPV
ncbi:hypothetical protein D3C85_1865500 [compost metagenome]